MAKPDDSLLSDNDIESELSTAYVHAVAAHAGYNCGPHPGLDRDSIDVQISCSGHKRPKIDAQLKATINLTGNDTHYSFPLPLKNYNDLRIDTQTPRILIVLDLPKTKEDWLLITTERLVIQRSAYWVSLNGSPDVENKSKVSVSIPKANIFNVETLVALMEKSRNGSVV